MSMVIPTVMPKIELDLWTSYVQIDEVRLDWKCSAADVPYELQRQEDSSRSSDWVTIWEGRTTSYTDYGFDSSVTEGQMYHYRIVVGGKSSGVITVNIPKPTVAIDLQVQFISNNSLKLTWEPKQDITYKLQRQEGQNTKWTTVYTGGSNSLYERGLTPGQTYRYRVISGGLNIASEEITVYIDP